MGQFSNFVEVSQIHPDVVNWVYRVQTAGGAQPSQKTVNVLNNFYETLISNNLSSSMKAVNCFVPDSLIAAKTPLIANYGSSSWNDISGTFVSGDLTISGLKGNGSSENSPPLKQRGFYAFWGERLSSQSQNVSRSIYIPVHF